MTRWWIALGGALALTGLAATGCTGTIGDGPEGQLTGPEADTASPGRWRRLTRVQYRNAVSDLVGVTPDVSGFLDDTTVPDSPFPANAGIQPQELDIQNYWTTAELVAAQIDVAGLIDCTTIDEACAKRFIADFGRRAYRRPLDDAQQAALLEVFRAGTQLVDEEGMVIDDPVEGIRLTVQAMLQSGAFLYVAEYGEKGDDEVRRLDGYELASRLSFLLWNTTPDDRLLDAADNGALATAEGLLVEANRMMESERFIDTLVAFHLTMLGVEEVYGTSRDEVELTDELRDALVEEAEHYVRDVMTEDGTVVSLLTKQATYPTDALEVIYGVGGDGRAQDGLGTRFGVLTLPAFLIASPPLETHYIPTYRGAEIRKHLLCNPIPAPVIEIEFEDVGDINPRERLLEHKNNPSCSTCHELMDPIGFALENYDDLGRYRESDDWGPIDPAGYYVAVGKGEDVDIAGPEALGQALATIPRVRECFAIQWFRQAFARQPQMEDATSLDPVIEAFKRGDGDVREGLRALIASPAFRIRVEETNP